jgi:hypothetical protein
VQGLQAFQWVTAAEFSDYFRFIDTFLCTPKETYPKERAPCAPLLPACPELGRGARLKIFFAMQRK